MPKHRINPKRFWHDTLLAVTPIALITGVTVAFTYWITSVMFPGHAAEVATMTVLTATLFGVYLVFLVGIMLDVTIDKSAKRARLLYLLSVIIVAAGSFGFGFLRDFFDFTVPNIIYHVASNWRDYSRDADSTIYRSTCRTKNFHFCRVNYLI
ncbi:hypothetical protein KOY48_02300 [Candidatus Minimicrobia naudis]|uniref:Uncharacterized protein n=1 Tax=Candidatus Minimicrobia naudis TaxID=2841263 RepID=A0A8F1MCN5_9BACT|nr:hypothetical protein KOY48_02300 [Candidatus Minimicrobia naudis]